jgi:hypothetical protein
MEHSVEFNATLTYEVVRKYGTKNSKGADYMLTDWTTMKTLQALTFN